MQDYPDHHHQSPEESEAPAKGPGLGDLWRGLRRHGGRVMLAVLGLAILGALTYLVVSADGFIRNSELKKEKTKLEEEIEILEDENRLLRQKLERLQTDPAYVEDEARKKLRLIRPGETIYRLSEEPDISDQGPPREPPPIP